MSEYGTAVIRRNDDGTLTVVSADDTIGIASSLLAEDGSGLVVDADGCVLLAMDPQYRYRPVRFASYNGQPSGPPAVVVCERVKSPGQ